MMKQCRRLAVLVCILLLTVGMACAEETLRGYQKGGGYQYISLGEYPYEKDGAEAPVLWQVLEVKDGQALLHTKYIIEVQQVIFVDNEKDIKNYNYRRIESYAESDLCTWMNETMLDTLLGDDSICSALVETEFGKLYILTDGQYLTVDYGFTASRWGENKKRQAVGTPYAKKRGLYVSPEGKSPYWVAAVKAASQYKLQLVGYNGHLSYGAYSRSNVGIRAAMTIDLSKCHIESGSGTEIDPFILAINEETAIESETVTTLGAALPFAVVADESQVETEETQEENLPIDETQNEEELIKTAEEQTEENSAEKVTAEQVDDDAEKADASAVQKDSVESRLLLSFIGDCSIGDASQSREVETSLTKTVAKNGYAWPFSTVSDYLKNDDYTFANLEVCLTTKDNLKSSKKYNMIAPPEHTQILIEGGVDAVNTVNNHCMDFGYEGYQDTLNALDSAGINHFGTVSPGRENGSDILGYATVKGVKIGMLGFTYPQDADLKRIETRITQLKEEGCQLVVVSLHWGRETHMTSDSWQYAYAKKVIDYGADVIWGHHPHVVQPIMFYKGKPIFFSTGNFIFGTMSEVDPSTGIFQLEYSLEDGQCTLDTMRVIPCETTRGGDYRPRVLTDEDEKEKCFRKLISKKTVNKLVNLPESFAKTGIVRLNADGEIIEE